MIGDFEKAVAKAEKAKDEFQAAMAELIIIKIIVEAIKTSRGKHLEVLFPGIKITNDTRM